ncbi:MAG TPA: hypothetical protein VK446_09265 [Methylocystis sp.]|nr:hypothetical protein [Methylocystis sp.]
MRRKRPNWTKLVTDSMKLGFDANRVVALRLAKLARGGASAKAESRLMVAEKIKAVMDAQNAAARSLLLGQSHLAPERALSVYKKRVRKNLTRLARRP